MMLSRWAEEMGRQTSEYEEEGEKWEKATKIDRAMEEGRHMNQSALLSHQCLVN